MAVRFGIDNLLAQQPHWKGKRIALVTNHAATTHDLTPSREALLRQGFNIVHLFSPEHGLDVRGADGHEMKDGKDVLTSLPVTSLYSAKLAPAEEDLADIDIVLFDIPDVGSRFYTYLWTMTHVLEACARYQKKLIVLDRPNPVSGKMELVEGPMLDEAQASFIGRWRIPVRHSCTMGELANYFNHQKNIGCNLEVIRCENWERDMFQPDWKIRFVSTSPAIQHFESMLLYPGLCLLEATNISEGRGTPYAFCSAAAPWMNGRSIAGLLNDMGLDDVEATPVTFTPNDVNAKYYNEVCSGVKMQVREPAFFQSVSFGLLLTRLVKQLYPQAFEWRAYPTLVNPTGKHHLDKLLGMGDSEKIFELPLPVFIANVTRLTRCDEWKAAVEPYLLY